MAHADQILGCSIRGRRWQLSRVRSIPQNNSRSFERFDSVATSSFPNVKGCWQTGAITCPSPAPDTLWSGGRRPATLSSPAVGSLIESTKPSALEPLLPYRSDYSFRGKLPPTLHLQSATISLYFSVRKIRSCRSFYNSPNLYPVISIHIFLRLANLIIVLVFQAYPHSFHFILQVQYFFSIFVNGCGFSQ